MEETEDESTDAEGKGEEDMVHADMMAAGCDAEEGDLENLELDDIKDVIDLHLHAKEDSGMSASREQFKGHFLCMLILRYTLT